MASLREDNSDALPEELLAVIEKAEEARKEQGNFEMEVLMSEDKDFEGAIHKRKCDKNPGHQDFIAVKELAVEHLPEKFQFQGFLDWIKFIAVGTVKLYVRYTSPDRPDCLGFGKLRGTRTIRVGSGYFLCPDPTSKPFWQVQPCPFEDCAVSKEPHQVGVFDVSTASHVICDNKEAVKTEVEFLFDDETDRSPVVKAKGIRVKTSGTQELTYLSCATHSLDFWDRLRELWSKPKAELVLPMDSSIAFTISHPHGCEKKITFGDVEHFELMGQFPELLNNPLFKNLPKITRPPICKYFTYTAPTCPGSSGCLVMALKKDRDGLKCCSAPHSQGGDVNRSGMGMYTERRN